MTRAQAGDVHLLGADGLTSAAQRPRRWRLRAIACSLPVALAIIVVGACGHGESRPAPTAAPGPATVIEPERSIAGVRLASTAADLEARLGKPDVTTASPLHGGWVEWRYPRARLRVTLDGGRRVWSVRTYSPAHRTATGAGVGLTERRLRDAMHGLSCQPHGGSRRYRRWRVCADTQTYGGPFTSFTLVRGRVRYVTVAQGLAR
jgi:hypothetical protein